MDAPYKEPRPPLALTMGEPAGIGPELAIRAWVDRARHELPPFVIYADIDLLHERAVLIGAGSAVFEILSEIRNAARVFERALPVVPISLDRTSQAGKPDSANGPATILAIRRAVADVAAGTASAVVTNPIAKAVLYRAGFAHPGHTEYLGELANEFWPNETAHPIMMLAGPELRIVPVTIHVPLKDVPALLTGDKILTATRITAAALKRDFGVAHPRIAMTGLNPHAGEDGSLGTEDRDVIAPAIAVLRAEGMDVTGPHSADTLFHEAARRTYDAVIAMYHDQALIPIKTLSFDDAVNVTLGLPFVRTSPDHGTAFGLAGMGTASPTSLISALKLAHEMAGRRLGAATP